MPRSTCFILESCLHVPWVATELKSNKHGNHYFWFVIIVCNLKIACVQLLEVPKLRLTAVVGLCGGREKTDVCSEGDILVHFHSRVEHAILWQRPYLKGKAVSQLSLHLYVYITSKVPVWFLRLSKWISSHGRTSMYCSFFFFSMNTLDHDFGTRAELFMDYWNEGAEPLIRWGQCLLKCMSF